MAITKAEAASLVFGPDEVTGEIIPPTHPGEVLLEDFMKPLGFSAREVSRRLSVPANRITEIINGERSVSAHTAILLEREFGASAEFWLRLQLAFDLEDARTRMKVAA